MIFQVFVMSFSGCGIVPIPKRQISRYNSLSKRPTSPQGYRSGRMDHVKWMSTDEKSLDLRIAGYEFPRIAGHGAGLEEWDDANWLVIAGRVCVGFGDAWSFCHPCMTAFEAQLLGEWLEQVSEGGTPDPLGFLEPNLWFAAPNPKTVVVRFSYESSPSQQYDGQAEVVYPLDADELARAASEWMDEVRQHPPR